MEFVQRIESKEIGNLGTPRPYQPSGKTISKNRRPGEDGAIARIARVALPGYAYHVSHRARRRHRLFADPREHRTYLEWLGRYSTEYRLDIWAFCLMRDHVHLLAFAHRRDSLSNAIGRTHMRYSRWLNGRRGTGGGEVWSNRFDSSLLAPDRWWTVARYIERNPVRAGQVERAESYPWSSAHVHASGGHHPLLAPSRPFPGEVEDWSGWLEEPVDPEAAAELRRQTSTGRPTGSVEFIREIEETLGRRLRPRKRGRKPRREKAPSSLSREAPEAPKVSRGDSIAML